MDRKSPRKVKRFACAAAVPAAAPSEVATISRERISLCDMSSPVRFWESQARTFSPRPVSYRASPPAPEATVASSKVVKLLGACALCLALVAGLVLLIKRLL